MERDWIVFFRTLNQFPACFCSTLRYAETAPLEGFDELLCVTVRLLSATEDGLPLEAEFEILDVLAEALESFALEQTNIAYVGHCTHSGYRFFYFYTPSGQQYKPAFEDILSSFFLYSWDIEQSDDARWLTYCEFLLPTDEEAYAAESEANLRDLAEEGIDLSSVKRVEHFVFFADEQDAVCLDSLLAVEGFSAHPLEPVPESEETGLSVNGSVPKFLGVYEHDIPVEELTDHALFFRKAVAECNAAYDGWEINLSD